LNDKCLFIFFSQYLFISILCAKILCATWAQKVPSRHQTLLYHIQWTNDKLLEVCLFLTLKLIILQLQILKVSCPRFDRSQWVTKSFTCDPLRPFATLYDPLRCVVVFRYIMTAKVVFQSLKNFWQRQPFFLTSVN